MSGKKEWPYVAPTESGFYNINGDMFVTVDKYEAEKQRADSIAYAFKKYRREMSEDYQKTWERADRLEKEISEYATISYMLGAENYKDKVKALKEENQKLKEALEHIAYNPEGAAKYAWDKLEALK